MPYDPFLEKIADYVINFSSPSHDAINTSRLCLADSMGCAMAALQFDECRKILGPWVPGTLVPNGCRIPGLNMILDPVSAAFTFGSMVRWLDFNDTFLAAEWAHPSDNIGGLLPLMDYLSQTAKKPLKVHDLLLAIIKAYEIQGAIALENSFNQIGYDHVILIKFAMSALATHLLGGSKEQVMEALSQAIIDLGPLRTYRHAPNTGLRKSWAAGDAASRGVALAMLTLKGAKGYQTPLSTPIWGLEAVLFQNKPLKLSHCLNSYIIENILFKVTFPAEFHAQTAIEAALNLRNQIKNLEEIEKISIMTHEAAIRIIDKKGPLKNHADRDHCMQYMVAIALIHGELTADHYKEEIAKDPRIDILRSKIEIREHPPFSKDYLDKEKRSIASSMTITLKNGLTIGPTIVEFPLGHKRRREESTPLLFQKLKNNLSTQFDLKKVENIIAVFQDQKTLEELPILKFMDLFLKL